MNGIHTQYCFSTICHFNLFNHSIASMRRYGKDCHERRDIVNYCNVRYIRTDTHIIRLFVRSEKKQSIVQTKWTFYSFKVIHVWIFDHYYYYRYSVYSFFSLLNSINSLVCCWLFSFISGVNGVAVAVFG